MSDWKSRAEREAAAIIAEALPNQGITDYELTVALVAIGWMQGTIFGNHEALERLDAAAEALKASL